MSKRITRDEADNALEALRMIGVNAGHGDYSKTLAFKIVRRLNQQQRELDKLRGGLRVECVPIAKEINDELRRMKIVSNPECFVELLRQKVMRNDLYGDQPSEQGATDE